MAVKEEGLHSVPPPAPATHAGASVRSAPVPPLCMVQPEEFTAHAKCNLAVGALEAGVPLLAILVIEMTPS